MTSSPSRDPALQALLDKQEISEVLMRYSRAVDRGDVDLLRECYHTDATEDHGGTFAGSANDYIDKIAPMLPRGGVLTHAVSNVLIELAGDGARVEAYITTFARMKKDGEKFDTMTLARTLDRFERRDQVWRIAARRLTWEWHHEMPMTESWGRGLMAPNPAALARGGKKPNDMLYRREEP
jgi:ketosteroid isomerase-like protein